MQLRRLSTPKEYCWIYCHNFHTCSLYARFNCPHNSTVLRHLKVTVVWDPFVKHRNRNKHFHPKWIRAVCLTAHRSFWNKPLTSCAWILWFFVVNGRLNVLFLFGSHAIVFRVKLLCANMSQRQMLQKDFRLRDIITLGW